MQRGIRVSGTVTDADDKPVAALAIWGDDPYSEHRPQQEVRTDDQGVYKLPPLPPGPMHVTVVAKDWMPQTRAVDISQSNPAIDFKLQTGKALRIHLLTIPASRCPTSRFRSRGGATPSRCTTSNIPMWWIPKFRNSDANGGYQWTWAPDDAVTYRLSAIGGFSTPEATFTADDEEHEFVLHRLLEITGRVTDAATGRPIEKFTVMPVLDFKPILFSVERRQALHRTGGKYSLGELDRTDVAYRVRIEADGYRTAMSDQFHVGDRQTTWDFKLETAPPAAGRVLDEQGDPVPGAKVYLATKSQSYESEDGLSNNFEQVTNQRGEFSFPAQFERYAVIVNHEKGYAETLLKPGQTPGDLRLKSWAKVEGRLLQDGKPVPEAAVYLRLASGTRFGEMPYINNDFYTKTDTAGHFEFPRVPPVKCSVGADLSPWQVYPITSSQYVPLDLQSGQKVMLELGGKGTQVTGKVALKGVGSEKFDLNWSLNDLLRMQPGIEPPEEIRALGFDWRHGWNDAWTVSLEGRAYLNTLHRDFVRLTSDGRLLVNGVPPGDYQLALKVYEHNDPKACLVNAVATNVVRFHVSEADAEKPSFDLGTIELETARGPQPGEHVPDFELKTVDGQSKKLSDFRGHCVLVDFWAPWCAPARRSCRK